MMDSLMKVSLTLVAIDKMSKVICDAVNKSNSEFDKLQNKIQKTSDILDKLGQNMTKLGAGMTATGLGLAYKLGIPQAIPEAIALEHQLRELGNVGQLSAEQLRDMDERLGSISRYTNQMSSEIAEGLNVLVASGIDPTAALDYMNVIGRTATAAQAEIVDISKTAFSVTDNLKVNVNDLGKTMDILAQAGKEGRFELKDMSAAFPSLTAGASMLGMRGVPAVAQLGAALQIAMKGAGQASEAANNLENFIQKVTSPLAIKNFKEVFGVDLKKVLIDAANQGKDPILEVIELMTRLSGGDVFKISEVFQDKQVLNFIKPMMQNLDEYKRIKAAALNSTGVVESDFNNMMETTSEQFKLLKINMNELVFPHLHKPIEKINEILTKINQNPLLQKGLFSAIIGTIGIGLVLTTLGTATMLVGKLVKGYGEFLGYAHNIAPVLKAAAPKILDFLGLHTASHNLTFGAKIAATGNPLGFDLSNFSLGKGIVSDIKRIDNNLRKGIIKGFKELPANITKSSLALKDWGITSLKALPSTIIKGLTGFKNAFLGIPGMIGKAITAFRAFSITLLTSPIGWIALAIGAVVFVIYKYWKPITAFFRGLWKGLKAGLQPLMPVFKQIIEALQPIIKPIKAIINWFKKVIKPVEDTGGAAEAMGVKFGKAIANIILKIAKLVTKIFEFGQKIGDMLAKGIRSKKKDTEGAINEHAQIIRDHLPHSPAKVGPLKDLNKLKIIETIVSTMKPAPLVNAMNKTMGLMVGGMKVGVGRVGVGGGTSFIIHYSPSINMPGGTTKDEFSLLLKQHKDEVVSLFKRELERKERLAY